MPPRPPRACLFFKDVERRPLEPAIKHIPNFLLNVVTVFHRLIPPLIKLPPPKRAETEEWHQVKGSV